MSEIQRNFLLGLGIVVLVGGGLYYWTTRPKAAPVTANPNASTTIQILPDGTIIAPDGLTVKDTTSETTPAPNYKAALKFDASVSADVRAALEAKAARDVAALNKDPLNFSAWMDLAIARKIAGDYQGAAEIWLYGTKKWPTSPVPFHNLADLYQNFLHDSAKASYYANLAAKLGWKE